MIENFDVNDTASRYLFLAESLGPAGPSGFIEAQEKRGQQQLVNSDRMPADTRGTDAQFEALGFTFGDPDPADPLFRPATLPDGWKREASDHDMWSYVVDELGRRRVGVFYKAAFYDRRAHAAVHSLHAYINERQYDGEPIVLDDVWATREAVLAIALGEVANAEGRIAGYVERGREDWVADEHAERDRWAAVAAAHDGPPGRAA